MRDQLRELWRWAGSPTVDSLHEHACLRGHSVSRGALAGVKDDSDHFPRWATIVSFVYACHSYSKGRKHGLTDDEVELTQWRIRYDQASPGPWRKRTRPAPSNSAASDEWGPQPAAGSRLPTPKPAVRGRHRVGVVAPEADCAQQRAADPSLAEALAGDGVTPILCQVLIGPAGVGKTQLAARAALQMWRDERIDLWCG